METLPGCGCIFINYPSNPILPEEEGVVSVTVNTFGQSGSLQMNKLVKSNTQNKIFLGVEFQG